MSAAVATGHVTCLCGVTAYPALNMNERMQIAPCCPSCGREHLASAPTPAPAKVLQLVKAVEPYSTDPVALIQKRLAFLDEELAKAANYTKERRRLRRMLKAAGELT